MNEFVTQSNVPLKRIYTLADIKGLNYERDLNDAGAFPYTRGRHAEMYRRQGWILRELSGEGDPINSNRQLKELVKKGQTGIDVIGDTPTMATIDADHPMAEKAIGTQGVSLCCLQDYKELLDGIPLDKVTVSCSLPSAIAVPALYLVAQERGIPKESIRGSVIQLPFYCEDCGYSVRQPFSMRARLTTDCIEFCASELPSFHSFVEDTYYISEAGLDSVEEIALGLVEARHIIRRVLKRGLGIDRFAHRIAILVTCRMDFFEEIAKIRALRRLWARMMKEEFGAKDERSLKVAITAHTSGISLTSQQPGNNIVRGTLEALALVLAGVQAIEISAFDEAYRIPTPESHLLGLRTQQVIQLESNTTKVVDPLGGSYFLESLTNELENRIGEYVRRIESMGDPAELSDKGVFKAIFDKAIERYINRIKEGTIQKVGVNIFPVPEEEDTLLKEIAERKFEPCFSQIRKLKELKKKRNNAQVRKTLQELWEASKKGEANLLYPIATALKAKATMGEIIGVIRLGYNAPFDPFGALEAPI